MKISMAQALFGKMRSPGLLDWVTGASGALSCMPDEGHQILARNFHGGNQNYNDTKAQSRRNSGSVSV
jgi:hypothetical protein